MNDQRQSGWISMTICVHGWFAEQSEQEDKRQTIEDICGATSPALKMHESWKRTDKLEKPQQVTRCGKHPDLLHQQSSPIRNDTTAGEVQVEMHQMNKVVHMINDAEKLVILNLNQINKLKTGLLLLSAI